MYVHRTITSGAKIDVRLKEMLGQEWQQVLCPDWTIGKVANESAAWGAKHLLYSRGMNYEEFIDLLEEREEQLDQVGPLLDHDCLLFSLTTLQGQMSWVKHRAKILWHAGHLYDATNLYMIGHVKPWTPFRFINSQHVSLKQILRNEKDEAWSTLSSHMSAWSLTWAAAFMQNPVSAKLKALELASYCQLPEDYEGHPAKVELHHIPNRYTHTWLMHCLQKAIPQMQEYGSDINAGYDDENVFHEVAMMGNGARFGPESVFGGKTVSTALLEAGADPRTPDHTGYNTLHLSTHWSSPGVVKALHEFEDGKYWDDLVKAKDLFGRTAFDMACEAEWIMNALGEEVMGLLGGGKPCDPSLLTANLPYAIKAPNQQYCMGDEQDFDKDMGVCTPGGEMDDSSFQEGGLPEGETEHCDLEVIDGTSPTFNMYTFIKHYMSMQRPVVIRNAFTPKANSDLKFIREHLSNARFTQVSVPYSEKYGRKTRKPTKVGDFLKTCMNEDRSLRDNKTCSNDGEGKFQDYIFEVPKTKASPDNQGIIDIFTDNLPGFIDYSYDPQRDGSGSYLGCPQYYSGPANSGSQMHTHIMAHNMLYEGQKLWWFLPPLLSFTSNIHAIQWRDELVQEQPGALTCTQHAGDVFFVPTHWGHGLLNQDDSFGFACEFEWSPW